MGRREENPVDCEEVPQAAHRGAFREDYLEARRVVGRRDYRRFHRLSKMVLADFLHLRPIQLHTIHLPHLSGLGGLVKPG